MYQIATIIFSSLDKKHNMQTKHKWNYNALDDKTEAFNM